MPSPGHDIQAVKARDGRNLVLAVLLISLFVSAIEMVLLEVKYGSFSGGFLQDHALASGSQRLAFAGVTLLLNLCFFLATALFWYGWASRRKAAHRLALYDWSLPAVAISIGALVIRYQIHSYFGDFLTFAIVKNLGGDSILASLRYVAEEGALAGLGIGGVLLLFFVGRHFVKRLSRADPHVQARPHWRGALVALTLGAALVAAINRSDEFWHHARRLNAYLVLDSAMALVTDFDRDGAGIFSHARDMAPFDAAVYPGALDTPGNRIDEDGLAGDFQYRRPTSDLQFSAQAVRHPNIVLLVLESTRADAIDARSSQGQLAMPNLQRLAKEGTRSEAYYSPTGYTISSLRAIFTGSVAGNAKPLLLPTLHAAGYEINVISGQDEQFGDIAKATGAAEFADRFFDARSHPERRVFASAAPGSLTVSNADVGDHFAEQLRAQTWAKPQFFYINLQAAHFPYHHDGMPNKLTRQPLARGEISAARRQELWDTYLNACAYSDAELGRIEATLKAAGQWGDTLLVVVGDHGESLFDDGFLGHGFQINDLQLRTVFVANRKLDTPAVFGHAHLAELILKQAGFQASGEGELPGVFHYLGSLSRPSLIGLHRPDGSLITLDPVTRQASYVARRGAAPKRLQYPAEGSEQAAALRELVLRWERLRWESHLRQQATAPKQ